jgi:hypothetical protein
MELTTIQSITGQFCDALRSKLAADGTNATSKLSKSIKGIVKYDGKYLTVSLRLEEYYKFVENGTSPHFPPLDAIKKWIKVKPVLPRPLKSGKLPTTNQLAYLIGRKISKVGTKAKPFLSPTLTSFDFVQKVYNEVMNLITKELENEVE